MTNPMKACLSFLSKPDGGGCEFIGPALSDPTYFGMGVGIGLRKDSDALLKRIDDAVIAMNKDEFLDKFSKKYFPSSISPKSWKGIGQ